MSQKVNPTYDVDARVKELIPSNVTVAGFTFEIKRSGKVLRKIIAMNPDPTEFEKDDEGKVLTDAAGVKIPKSDPDEDIRMLYESLSILFVDPATRRPPVVEALLPPVAERVADDDYPDSFAEWLEEEMDIEAAQELLGKLVPRGGEGNPTATVSDKTP